MKIQPLTTLIAAPLLMLLMTVPAPASELKREHLPENAKWVLHVDLEALGETTLAEQVRQNRPVIVRQVRQWFDNRYGVDPREDLKSVTMYSDTYQSHTGTLVLKAKYDRNKVESDLQNKEGVQTTSWQDHTLYIIEKEGMKKSGRNQGGDDNQQANKRAGQKATIVLVDDETTVFASSPERAKAAIQLLKGEAASLKADSKLIANRPDGAIVYGAAIDLSSIEQREGFFPVLKQHEQIVWYVGEKDGETFETLTLVAGSEEVAKNMKETLDGLVAFGKVWAADSEALRRTTEKTEVSIDGKKVQAKWRGKNEEVLQALGEVRERLMKRWEAAQRR